MSTHIPYRKTQVQIEQKIKIKFVKSGQKSVDRRGKRHLV